MTDQIVTIDGLAHIKSIAIEVNLKEMDRMDHRSVVLLGRLIVLVIAKGKCHLQYRRLALLVVGCVAVMIGGC